MANQIFGMDPTSLAIQAGLAVSSAEGELIQDWSRNNYKNLDPTLVNVLFTGENANQVINSVGTGIDFSNEKNNVNLANSWNNNNLQDTVQAPSGWEQYDDYLGTNLKTLGNLDLVGFVKNQVSGFKNLAGLNDAAKQYNDAVNRFNQNTIDNFYNTAQNNQMRNQKQAMMNYFAEGGDMGNGITMFNTGGTHEQNPYSGIQQGIASDGLPNTVEEGEVKYKDYIYSNRLKPNKTLIKDNNLPEKYFGLTYAEMAEKLQKESEDRPNDPISIKTLEDWMSRLASAQETQKAQIKERKLAKALDSMSTEDKAILMNSLMQQQEGIDLSQPMYAKGGKIFIKPSKRGTFTAAAKKHGKSVQEFASQVLANKENYSPAMVNKANFARNAAHWHKGAYGLNLDIPPYVDTSSPYYGLEVIEPEERQPLTLNITDVPTLNFLDIVAANQPNRIGAPWADPYIETTSITETPRAAAIKAAANPIKQQEAYDYWKSQQNPDLFKNTTYDESEQKKKDLTTPPPADKKGLNFNAENLRYAPAVGAGIGALVAALQPVDYTLSNEYRNLASQLNPVAAPHIGDYRRYTPYDVNLGDAENLALEAAAIRANRGQNRATQAAQNIATINAFQRANAQRNLAAQQANEADRLAVDTYNLGIDQFNAQRDTQYDQLNQQILNNRLNMLAQAAKAADASRTARANMINTTGTNFFNQLGNVGQDTWNYNELQKLFERLGYDKEAIAAIAGRYYGNKG